MPALPRCLLFLTLLALTSCGEPPTPAVPKAIIVRLERLTISQPPSLVQVQPYDEGLVFHSYAVKEVLHGELAAPTLQLGHWAVVDGVPQTIAQEIGEVITAEILPIKKVPGADDLYQANDLDDFESPQFIEVPPANQPVATGFRFHYGGPISKQMRLYWELRHQLRLVAMGNSRTGVGVLTGQFFPETNSQTPIALNLSPPGSNLELQSLILRDYALPLPNLQWVVWGICPRYFNQSRRESDRLELFTDSHGYHFDQDNHDELWPILTRNTPITVAEAEELCPAGTDIYGATPRPDGQSPVLTDPAARRKFLDYFSIVRFKWDQPQWDLLVETARAFDKKGIRVLLFTPPTHPLAREGKACDPDGSGPEHDALVVGRIRALDAELPHVWFEDIHHAGHHDFTEDDFSDAGHLDHSGAQRLTQQLVARIQQIQTQVQHP